MREILVCNLRSLILAFVSVGIFAFAGCCSCGW